MPTEQESEFGDFEEIKDEAEEAKKQQETQQHVPSRIRMPRQGQFMGIVLERLGGKRMSVKTTDDKIRNCRVPGRFRRKFWLRPGHIVLIEPWPDDDNKADIVYQYRKNEVPLMKRRGLLDKLQSGF